MYLIIVFSLLFSDPCNDPNMYGYFSSETGLYITCPKSQPMTENYSSQYDHTPELVIVDTDTDDPFFAAPSCAPGECLRWKWWERNLQRDPNFVGIVTYKQSGCYANAAKPSCYLDIDDPIKGPWRVKVTAGTWNRAWIGGKIGLCGAGVFGHTSERCRHYRLSSITTWKAEQ